MNAEAQSRGLPAILKSLNCDRGYGLGLLAACALDYALAGMTSIEEVLRVSASLSDERVA